MPTKEHRLRYLAAGMCGVCGRQPPKPGRVTCQVCIDRIAATLARPRNETPEQRSARISRQNILRWQTDREKMLAVALANAAKGSAALRGTHYTPERSARASQGQHGKVMGGKGARGPEHYFAVPYALISPGGERHEGSNLLEFIRQQPWLFPASTRQEIRGTCLAAKKLYRLRPSASGRRPSWRGWRWATTEVTAQMRREKRRRWAAWLHAERG